MRRKYGAKRKSCSICIIDDEIGIIESVSIVLNRHGYDSIGYTDPIKALEEVKKSNFDMIILDYLMINMRGDEFVRKVREFNKDIYILLLTGHKDMAPPLETLKTLDIQGYCEKSDRFDQLILLVESGIKSINQVNTINRFKDGLDKILKTIPEIYQLGPVNTILEEILSGVMYFIECKDAFILADDVHNISKNIKDKSIFKGIGKFNVDAGNFMEMLNSDFIALIGLTKETQKVANYEDGVMFPLINERKMTIGVIFVDGRIPEYGLKLLEIYSKQAAVALSNAFLHSLVNIKNEELNNTYDKLKVRYLDTIQVLRLTVDVKDIYTRGHSDRVAYYSVLIGKAFNVSEEELEILKLGGLFHDIGKIGTSDNLLFKTDGLSSAEYNEIKKHTLKGAHILSAVSMFNDVVPLIKYHHERVDGRGYPEGLNGDQIPFFAKILSVADAFDAMTSNRIYRKKIRIEDAIKQLQQSAGSQFDEEIVEMFVGILENYEQIQQEIACITEELE